MSFCPDDQSSNKHNEYNNDNNLTLAMVVTTPAHTCATAVTIQTGEHRAYGEWVNAVASEWRHSPYSTFVGL